MQMSKQLKTQQRSVTVLLSVDISRHMSGSCNFISELNDAILSRDADKLRKAIAHVERNNYTKRLAAVCCYRYRAVLVETFVKNS